MNPHPVGPNPCEIIRLKTSMWRSDKGIHIRRDLVRMKRLSTGYEFLQEDASMAGVDKVFSHIVNLDESKDGLYIVQMCNEQKDWETGNLEEWDYRLVPFAPTTTQQRP